MISCSDCVKELKTARLADIRAGSPVAQHYTSCEDCKRLVHALYHSERDLAVALDSFGAGTNPSIVAENAIDAMYRRRKKIARTVRALLAIAGVGVLGVGIAIVTEDGDSRSWRGETIELKCLSGAEASNLARRFMVSGESQIVLRDNERTLVLEGHGPEVVEAASQVVVQDGAACDLPGATPEQISAPAEKSDRD